MINKITIKKIKQEKNVIISEKDKNKKKKKKKKKKKSEREIMKLNFLKNDVCLSKASSVKDVF